jgi:hypothetical protein
LAASRYASPQYKARVAAFPSAFPSPTAPNTPNGNGNASNTAVATKEQLAAIDTKGNMNPDAQLAMAQQDNFRKDVDKHSAKVAKSISSAVANTRQVCILGACV